MQKKLGSFPEDLDVKQPRPTKFLAIFWSLLLCDVTEVEENQKKKGTSQYDWLFKIKPLYSQIVNGCNSLFQPGWEITIHKKMVARPKFDSDNSWETSQPSLNTNSLFWLNKRLDTLVYQGNTVNVQGEGLSYSYGPNKLRSTGKRLPSLCWQFLLKPSTFSKTGRQKHLSSWNHSTITHWLSQNSTEWLWKKTERGNMWRLRQDNLLFASTLSSERTPKEVTMCSSFHKVYSGDTTRRRVKEAGQWQLKTFHSWCHQGL